jgi:hypothetical protein
MSRAALFALAERCEAAAEPDRKLDAEIAEAIERRSAVSLDRIGEPSHYTSSLDAAVSLLSAGWAIELTAWPEGECSARLLQTCPIIGMDGLWHGSADRNANGRAKSLALAIDAAALRWRAAMKDAP